MPPRLGPQVDAQPLQTPSSRTSSCTSAMVRMFRAIHRLQRAEHVIPCEDVSAQSDAPPAGGELEGPARRLPLAAPAVSGSRGHTGARSTRSLSLKRSVRGASTLAESEAERCSSAFDQSGVGGSVSQVVTEAERRRHVHWQSTGTGDCESEAGGGALATVFPGWDLEFSPQLVAQLRSLIAVDLLLSNYL